MYLVEYTHFFTVQYGKSNNDIWNPNYWEIKGSNL